jgi:hypothetical protein
MRAGLQSRVSSKGLAAACDALKAFPPPPSATSRSHSSGPLREKMPGRRPGLGPEHGDGLGGVSGAQEESGGGGGGIVMRNLYALL